MRDAHILAAVFDAPWMITETKKRAIEAVALRHAAGIRLSTEQITALVDAVARPAAVAQQNGAIAVMSVMGVIAQRMNLMSAFSGGTSTEQMGREFDALVADPQISAIVLNIDSPGGSVFGVPELADKIFKARGSKPIVAVSNSEMASAAYYLGSQADQVVATPSSLTGSIGVIASHVDESELLANEGVKVTYISAGKYKAEGNPAEPLNDEARGALQHIVDQYYGQFVAAVARGRGVSATDVRNGFGQGRVLTARDALRAGMVDRIATLDEVISDLQRGKRPARMAAQSPNTDLAARRAQLEQLAALG